MSKAPIVIKEIKFLSTLDSCFKLMLLIEKRLTLSHWRILRVLGMRLLCILMTLIVTQRILKHVLDI